MAVKTLAPMSYTTVPTYVPWSKRIKYRVEAERPVDTFMIDREDIDRYDEGEHVPTYGKLRRGRLHVQRGKLPYSGDWVLVITNANDRPVAIHYEVS